MITITTPQIRVSSGEVEVSANIDGHATFVRWPGDQPPSPQAAGDAMFCFGLIPAMAQARDLDIAAPVSDQLLYQGDTIQDIILRWYPDRFRRIRVRCEPELPSTQTAVGVGTFFTGGIDSMFTLLTEKEQLSHSIYVHGYDVKLKDAQHREIAASSCRSASQDAGVRLIEVETNLRHYSDLHTNWLTEFMGGGLAGVAHLLSGEVGRVLFPSSNSYETLPFLGSDPLLDLQWRTELLDIIHHGADHRRIEKAAAIAEWPTAQNHLRVCGKNVPGQINCGQCEKCARTLLIFEILGAYEAFVGNFANPLPTPAAVDIEVAPDPGKWSDWNGMLELAAEKNENPELVAALRKKLQEREHGFLTNELRPFLKETIDSAYWKKRWPKFRNKILASMAESDPQWFEARVQKNLPALREQLAQQLGKDPGWLKRKLRCARWKKFLGRKP